jgi:hypothetical protein
LYYDTTGNATVTANTGSFVLNSLSNTFAISAGPVPNSSVREFTARLRTGSASGPIVATSNSAYVIDSSLAYMGATGGNEIYIDNGFKVHVFRSSNTFAVTRSGASLEYSNVRYLIVAGGGGGGAGRGGGGGAGGLLRGNITATATPYVITVGAGGLGSTDFYGVGTNGNNSVFANITTFGGGFATGPGVSQGGNPGGSGGSGPNGGGANVAGQGYPGSGGSGLGGGGAGGFQGGGLYNNGGGPGLASDITGTSTYYAGGGGGGGQVTVAGAGAGGLGGGGAGALNFGGWNANAFTGGGGGGSAGPHPTAPGGPGGNGGSGIVILRYPFVEAPSIISLSSSNITFDDLQPEFTLNTLNLANNTLLYYTTVGNVVSSDFVTGNTGSFRTTANTTSITLSFNSIPTNEERFFQLQIREDGLTAPVIITSNVITVKDAALKTSATSVQYLVVGGGGGGIAGIPGIGGLGAGGAGGLLGGNILSQSLVTPGTPYTITVGGGGASKGVSPVPGNGFDGPAAFKSGNPGNPTTFNSITATGGGGGSGSTGGTGGGGSVGQGYSGAGGGGGGAGAAAIGNTGGIGIQTSISGSSQYYAGGGAGGVYYSGTYTGTTFGGLGGGGNSNVSFGFAGTTNTGGGGGAGNGGGQYAPYTAGGSGGSGVVVIAVPGIFIAANATTGSPNVIYANNNIIYRFWQSGTITF